MAWGGRLHSVSKASIGLRSCSAAQQIGLVAGQAVEGQQQLLLQHPFAAVVAAEATDHGGNGAAAQGLADQRVVGVVAPHHQLPLAQQQVGEGVFELGVRQLERGGRAPHHAPVALLEGTAVDLAQQILERQVLVLGALQLGRRPQPQAQQREHLGLLLQGGALPQALQQIADGAVFQFQLLFGAQGRALGAGPQRRGPVRFAQRCSPAGFGRQGLPAGLALQLGQRGQLHRRPVEQAPPQVLAQPHKGVGIAAAAAARR